MTTETSIREMMWTAFINDVGIELSELAGSFILKEGLTRIEAYKKAFSQLGLSL